MIGVSEPRPPERRCHSWRCWLPQSVGEERDRRGQMAAQSDTNWMATRADWLGKGSTTLQLWHIRTGGDKCQDGEPPRPNGDYELKSCLTDRTTYTCHGSHSHIVQLKSWFIHHLLPEATCVMTFKMALINSSSDFLNIFKVSIKTLVAFLQIVFSHWKIF